MLPITAAVKNGHSYTGTHYLEHINFTLKIMHLTIHWVYSPSFLKNACMLSHDFISLKYNQELILYY